MRFKKIYIEITNACNLNCPFCIKNKRKINYITLDNYKFIINKIKSHTKEIYLHILGEPLLHPNIIEFIEYAKKQDLLVNITTNGYLINNINDNKNIHRLNISLHSYNEIYKLDIDTYLNNIFNTIDKIKDKTFISLRLWVGNNNTKYILNYINKRYNTNIINLENNTKTKIIPNLIIDTFHEFIWPDLNNNYYNEIGKCKGLIDHIGILSDGTIIPCCLDTMGTINLGNIYQEDIAEILEKDIVKEMITNFKKGYKCQELCKHCCFLTPKKNNKTNKNKQIINS